MNNISNPFFIIGSPRSGTTLLERILNRHSRLFIPPETEYFYLLQRYTDSFDEKVGRQALIKFLKQYEKEEAFQFLGLQCGSELYRLADGVTSFAELFCQLMATLADSSGKERWIEKTPHHLRYAEKISKSLPNSKFILLMRDGRAVINSRLKHPNWENNIVTSARKWGCDANTANALRNRLPEGNLYVLYYEKLLINPELEVRQLLDYLGEDYEENMVTPDNEKRTVKTDYYQQEWMKKSLTSLDSGRISGWENELKEKQIILIEKLVGKELEKWNYPVPDTRQDDYWQIYYSGELLNDLIWRIRKKMTRIGRDFYTQ